MADVNAEDWIKGIQGVPIVDSPAHFDLTQADVAAARAQGLEITSLRARSAHADERLFDRDGYLSDQRAVTLMHALADARDRLPPAEDARYRFEAEPGYGLTLLRSDGSLMYREASGLLLHNTLTPADETHLQERLARASVVSAQEAQQVMGRVIANLDRMPPDPTSTLTLEWEADQILLKRSDHSLVFHQLGATVLVNDFRQDEWARLTMRLSRINNPSPDPDPDLDR